VSSLTTETLSVSFLNGAPETILHPHSGLNLHFFHIISSSPEKLVFSNPSRFHDYYLSLVAVLKAFKPQIHSTVV